MNRFLELKANLKGRDFLCGDVHGKYADLMEAMWEVNFDKEKDRLILVGDLIDRGQGNMEMLELIGEPWFYTVIGNHEVMMAEAITDVINDNPYTAEGQMWLMNGGSWFYGLTGPEKGELENVYAPLIMEELPIAIELTAENGKKVGITHTDTPEQWPWWEVKKHLQDLVTFDNVVQHMLWARTKINNKNGYLNREVHGIDLLVHGHTPTETIQWRQQNTVYIDLGYYNKLKLINVMDLLGELDAR